MIKRWKFRPIKCNSTAWTCATRSLSTIWCLFVYSQLISTLATIWPYHKLFLYLQCYKNWERHQGEARTYMRCLLNLLGAWIMYRNITSQMRYNLQSLVIRKMKQIPLPWEYKEILAGALKRAKSKKSQKKRKPRRKKRKLKKKSKKVKNLIKLWHSKTSIWISNKESLL